MIWAGADLSPADFLAALDAYREGLAERQQTQATTGGAAMRGLGLGRTSPDPGDVGTVHHERQDVPDEAGSPV